MDKLKELVIKKNRNNKSIILSKFCYKKRN